MKNLKAKSGFTIAELLVAMMLIAGIAMIMMPTLMSDNERQIFATTLKKVYSQLQQTNQAIALLQTRGVISPVTTSASLSEAFFQTTKLASPSKATDLLEGYAIVPDKNGISPSIPALSAVGKNGIFYFFDNATGIVVVDVNGRKAPNTIGRDIFYFYNDAVNGTVEPYNVDCPTKKEAKGYCSDNPEQCKGCAYRILVGAGNGKIDYY